MNYQQTLTWLFDRLPMYQRVGAPAMRFGLDNMQTLSTALGDPHRKFKSVHIAGTNGKGSTAHMLASVLQMAGYKVGLYTSPHLKDFRERIRINGTPIEEDVVVEFVAKHYSILISGNYSFFEVTVAMAFSVFANEEVDIAIVEVGMGGRLDATNIVTPILSIITHISNDHQQFLGESVEEIAFEKAGIIKPNVPVIIGKNTSEVQQVLIEIADAKSSPVTLFDPTKSLNYSTDLLGDYQQENLANVTAALEALDGFLVPEKALSMGLLQVASNTGLQGRWQVLGDQPKVIADVAHNEAGISSIMKQVRSMQFAKLHIVFGMVNDKDFGRIACHLPKDAVYYLCSPNVIRAKPVSALVNEFTDLGFVGHTCDSVSAALSLARSKASSSDLVLVCGSLFTVAEVI
jgi:dihydrofolate synthase/folylpolyglutamate synthase